MKPMLPLSAVLCVLGAVAPSQGAIAEVYATFNFGTDPFLDPERTLSGPDQARHAMDFSHIGSLVDPEPGYRNADRIALAAAESGREVMISMEG